MRIAIVRVPRAGAATLTADLRTSGDRLRLESRLLAPEGVPLWHGKHDGQLGDAFDWQDATGSDVAAQSVAAIREWQNSIVQRKPRDALTWQDLMILALIDGSVEIEDMTDSLARISRAIALSPPSSYPYEFMLALIATASSLGYGDLVARYSSHFDQWAKIAGDLAGPTSSSRLILAFSAYVRTGDQAKARKEISAVLRDLPFDPDVLLFGGYLFQFLGEPENALACFRRFDEVGLSESYRPAIRSGTGASYVQMGRFEDALEELDAAIRLAPGYSSAYHWRAAALANLGRLDEARESLTDHERLVPGETLTSIRQGSRYADTRGLSYYFDGLRMAGMPELGRVGYHPPYQPSGRVGDNPPNLPVAPARDVSCPRSV